MSYTPTPGVLPAISDSNITQVNIDEINRGPAKLGLANTQLSPTNSDLARPLPLQIKSEGSTESSVLKHSAQPRLPGGDPRPMIPAKYTSYRPATSAPDPLIFRSPQPNSSGPFQLTPHIAATLKIPFPTSGQTMGPQILIEFINISVIKSSSATLHENLQPGMTPYEVVLTNQLLPGAEVVVAYPNQPVIWQGKEDGPERNSAINNLKASVWKHFTTTITQQLHQMNDPNHSHLHGYGSNISAPSSQILNRLRGAPPSNFPRSNYQNTSSPNPALQHPVPILPNGQYLQGGGATAGPGATGAGAAARRYPIPTPVPMSIPGMNGAQQPRGRQAWEQMATGFSPQTFSRSLQMAHQNQNNGTALLNATQQAYPHLVSHYFNNPQGTQQMAHHPSTGQVNGHALQLQAQQQQILKEMKAESLKELSNDILLQQQQQQARNANNSTGKYQSHGNQSQNKQNSNLSNNNNNNNSGSAISNSQLINTARKNLNAAMSVATATTSSNKRQFDDLKDYLPLTVNQPERSSTSGEQENLIDLKKMKLSNSLEFHKYPNSFDLAVAVLEDTPLSWDFEPSLQVIPSPNDYRALANQMVAMIAEKEAEKLHYAVASSSANANTTANSILATSNNTNANSNANITTIATNKGAGQMTTRSSIAAATPAPPPATTSSSKKSSKSKKEKEFAEEWVQCDLCARWRVLPAPSDPLYPKELPDKWICTMNKWNPSQAMCTVPEETASGSEVNTQRALKLRVWLRRLKSADRYETIALKCGNEENRTYGDVDWIRCSNSNCGKWRACLRSMDAKKLKKKYPVWYCWMNSWDEARSSCDAPQEGTIVYSFAEQYLNQQIILADDEDDDWNLGDEEEEGGSGAGDGNGLTLQGISSRGRIVRSRWNSRRSRR